MMNTMKRLSIVVFILASLVQTMHGQGLQQRLAVFRAEKLPEFKAYFTAADITGNNDLKLSATDGYEQQTQLEKINIMNSLLQSWPDQLVMVFLGTGRELWGWDADKNAARLIEKWDVNATAPAQVEEQPSRTALHPWFFYFGSMGQMDSDKNIFAALNFRVGFFLLRDKWDLAATISEQLTGNVEIDAVSLQTNVGLLSKIYYPMPELSLSPYAGGEAAVSIPSEGKAVFTPAGVLGVNWFMGIGSLDAGLRIGNGISLMIGYTVVPNYRFRK